MEHHNREQHTLTMEIFKDRGFTLLEILITVLLFTIGFIAVISIFSAAIIGNVDAENTSIAINLAQRRMEDIRNLSYASIVNESRAAVSGFPGFEREVGVTEPETDLKLVVINVYWVYKGDDVTIPLRTYVSAN